MLAKQADEIAAGGTDSLSQLVHPDLLGKVTLQIPCRIGCIGDLLSRDHTQGSAVGGTVLNQSDHSVYAGAAEKSFRQDIGLNLHGGMDSLQH